VKVTSRRSILVNSKAGHNSSSNLLNPGWVTKVGCFPVPASLPVTKIQNVFDSSKEPVKNIVYVNGGVR